jgi:hypothetical protein
MPTVFPPSPSNGDKWASGLVWTAPTFQKKLASELRNSTQFGLSNAISADGSTALIGAQGKYVDGVGTTGGVYAFNYSAGTWSQSQIITASDLADSDYFGSSVSMSADGNIAVIGAYYEDTSISNNGAAYIFTRSAGTWTQQAKLLASDPQGFSNFGVYVSISANGSTVIVGAPFADTGGAVYVFTGSGSTWTQQAKLTASDAASSDQFGYSAEISADGNTVLVGAWGEDTSPNSTNGAAYVFTRSGSTWTQQQKLLAAVRQNSAALGFSVALSSDGNSAFLGAFQSSSSVSFSGSVYYFTRSGSTWTQQQQISASDAASSDYFGYSVAISPDGSLLLVGAYGEDTSPNSNQGAVYSFRYSGSSWTQTNKYTASDAQSDENFGNGAISISSNGSKFIIGCPYENTSPNTSNGAVYFYDSPTYDLSTGTKYTYNAAKNLWTLDNASPVKAPTTHVFTSSQTWAIPDNAKMVHTWVIGAGGGGGGGCTVSANTASQGGSGGSGGALSRTTFNIIPGYNDTTATITIGAGGAGGAGGAAGGGSGSAGTSGSASTINFSTSVDPIGPITASGGAGGAGGTQSSSFASNTAQTLGMHYGSKGGRGVGGVFGSYFEDGLPSYGGAAGGGSGAGHPGTDTASRNGSNGGSVVPFSIPGGAYNTFTRIGSSSLVFGPGSGGGGGTSFDGGTFVYGGAGGLYGGGGGGGGSGGRTSGLGGTGGAGAQGVVVLMVWYG